MIISITSAALEIISAKDKNNVPPKNEFKLPDANDDMRRVFAYLTKQRFIAPDVISFFAHQHKIYEDRDHHNVVFVGTDENDVPKQASLRSTISFGKGHFIVMKTGCYPMKTRLKLFFKWGIKFEEAYAVEEQAERKVQYADRVELEAGIMKKFPQAAEPIEFENGEVISKKCAPKTRKK